MFIQCFIHVKALFFTDSSSSFVPPNNPEGGQGDYETDIRPCYEKWLAVQNICLLNFVWRRWHSQICLPCISLASLRDRIHFVVQSSEFGDKDPKLHPNSTAVWALRGQKPKRFLFLANIAMRPVGLELREIGLGLLKPPSPNIWVSGVSHDLNSI